MTVHSKRLLAILITVAFLLSIPLIAMQYTDQVRWTLFDFLVMGGILSGIGFAFELITRRSERLTGIAGKTVYRIASGVGLTGIFLLFWVNGAVGIIGSENQPANLLYITVIIIALAGSFVSGFKPRGMANTLFASAVVQLFIPLIALLIWPRISWGGAGMTGVLFLNAFFAILFIVSAFLFRQASTR